MVRNFLRRILRSAFDKEFAEQDAYYGRMLGKAMSNMRRAQAMYEELAEVYDELLTARGRDGT